MKLKYFFVFKLCLTVDLDQMNYGPAPVPTPEVGNRWSEWLETSKIQGEVQCVPHVCVLAQIHAQARTHKCCSVFKDRTSDGGSDQTYIVIQEPFVCFPQQTV